MNTLKLTLIKSEEKIRKEFAIPSDMPLWGINYLIGKYFDMEISTPLSFNLLEKDSSALIGTTAKDWKKYVGVWFMSPYRMYDEDDWCIDDDIDRKISGPYQYCGHFQTIEDWKEDLDDFINDYADRVIVSREKNEYGLYSVRPILEFEEYDRDKYIAYSFDELPTQYLQYLFDHNIDDLVITLTIEKIFINYPKMVVRNGYNNEVFTILIENSTDISKEVQNRVTETYTPIELLGQKNKV